MITPPPARIIGVSALASNSDALLISCQVGFSWEFVAWGIDFVCEFDFRCVRLNVFGQVYEDWSWSAGCGYVEGCVYHYGDFVDLRGW